MFILNFNSLAEYARAMVLTTGSTDISSVIKAIAIFVITLTLVIWQPRGLGIGFSAIGGAILALATGVVKWENIPEVWGIVWNATFTLIALVIISLTLDEAGFFRWLALHIARLGMGKGRWLWILTVLLGALVTALLTNDGAILIWVPTVLEMLLALGFSSKATMAFVMATGFIADATSLPFPVSNLVNIISADYFEIPFIRYALIMVPMNFVVIAISLGVLWFYFDLHIPDRYQIKHLRKPDSVIVDPIVFKWSFRVLGLLLIGYLFAEKLGIPICLIAGLGAWLMLAIAARLFHQESPVISVSKILRSAPWQVILFSLGMYLVVIGLRNVGLTSILAETLEALSHWGITLTSIGTGFLATWLCAIMNNLPTVLINAIAIPNQTVIDPQIREAMIYANIIGCDIGAKITPVGSLATLLWLHILNRKGIHISWLNYIQVNAALTIPVLLVTLLSLAIWLPLFTT